MKAARVCVCVCMLVCVQVAIGIGDLSWAQQCFRLAAALDPGHAEALNNLGVLQLKRRQPQQVGCWEGRCSHVTTAAHCCKLLARRLPAQNVMYTMPCTL